MRVPLWVGVLVMTPQLLAAQWTSVRPGDAVRVHVIGEGRVEGRAVRAEDGELVVRRASGALVTPLQVDSVWRRRSSAGRGAVIGAVAVGVPAGVLFGWVGYAIQETSEKSTGDVIRLGLLGLGVGAAAGAGAGALLGAALPHWQLHYTKAVVSEFRVLPSEGRRTLVGARIAL